VYSTVQCIVYSTVQWTPPRPCGAGGERIPDHHLPGAGGMARHQTNCRGAWEPESIHSAGGGGERLDRLHVLGRVGGEPGGTKHEGWATIYRQELALFDHTRIYRIPTKQCPRLTCGSGAEAASCTATTPSSGLATWVSSWHRPAGCTLWCNESHYGAAGPPAPPARPTSAPPPPSPPAPPSCRPGTGGSSLGWRGYQALSP
jgi:hypothetical protein